VNAEGQLQHFFQFWMVHPWIVSTDLDVLFCKIIEKADLEPTLSRCLKSKNRLSSTEYLTTSRYFRGGPQLESVPVERLDHLGVMASVIKDIELLEMINARLIPDAQAMITPGEAVAGMILNGLGFAHRPLSLTPIFCPKTSRSVGS
jgi:hypothetical protein